jgi:hypothetical protein
MGGIGIECQRPLGSCGSYAVLSSKSCQNGRSHPQGVRVVFTNLQCLPRQGDSLCGFRFRTGATTMRSLMDAGPADRRLGRPVIRVVNSQRPLEQRDGFAHTLVGVFAAQHQCAQIEVVGVEIFGRLAAGALELGLAQSGLDCTDDPARYLSRPMSKL